MKNERKINKEVKGVLFSDYDGTLFDLEKEIVPEGTWESFRRAKEAGFITCLVTGRPESSFKKVMTDTMKSGFNFIATDNGARLYEVKGNELHLLHVALLPREVNEAISQYVKAHNVAAVYNGINDITKHLDTEYSENKFIWKDNLNKGIQKESIQINLDGNHPDFMPEWQQNWHPTMTTFSSKAGKALTVEHIKELFPNATTFAFGDEENDINMFKHVEFGIAMKHANSKLKDVAKMTFNNEGYNVPKFINMLCDIEEINILEINKKMK